MKVVYLIASMEWADRRREIQGVRAFSRTRPDWQLIWADQPPPRKDRGSVRQATGIIAVVRTRNVLQYVSRARVPVVNISGRFSRTSVPQITPDQVGLGRIAAEHLLEHNYKRFVFVGNPDEAFSREREKGFRRAVRAGGGRVRSIRHTEISSEALLCKWTPPIAVMSYVDNFGPEIIRACLRARLEVPGDVAVVGVNNDDIFCDLAEVPLSSVDPNAEQIGYRSAELLDRMMRGESPPVGRILIPPRGIVVRRSSSAFALDDPDLRQTLEYIHDHACDPMTVTDVLNHIDIGRRTLEKRFLATLGRTLHDEIRRVQIEKAKRLLVETDATVTEVGQYCGFTYANRFWAVFREAAGMPPGRYREQHRPIR